MGRLLSLRSDFAIISSLGSRIARARWWAGGALLVGLAVTAVWALSTKRLYRSEAVLVFERGAQSGALGREGESPRIVSARLQDMVTSRQRLEAMIREMKLYQRTLEQKGLVEAIDEMRRHVHLGSREGFTYRVSFDGESRDLAKSVLDRLVTSIVDEDNKRRNQEADETRRFLDAERKQADNDLKEKEKELAAFLIKHPQLAAEVGRGATAGGLIRAADRDRAGASGGEAAALELQAAQLEESLAAAMAAARMPIRKGDVIADPTLTAAHTRAQAEVQAAQKDLAEKQMHLTNEHPDMKQAIRRLGAAEAAERRAAAAVAAYRPTVSPEAPTMATGDPAATARVNALRHALSAVRQQISAVKGRSVARNELPRAPQAVVAIDTDWTRLNREVSEARERQSQLEAKQFQAQLAATLTAGGQGGQLVIADPPFRPMRPVAGGRLKIALVGAVGSVLLALLVTMIFAALDDRLYGAHDVEGVLHDGIVVVIPKMAPRLTAPVPAQGKES